MSKKKEERQEAPVVEEEAPKKPVVRHGPDLSKEAHVKRLGLDKKSK